jgi:hypothetical protein
MGLLLIGLGAFRYNETAGWGFGAVGVGFLANAWVFSSLKEGYNLKSKISILKFIHNVRR